MASPTINFNSPLPLYYQLKELLKDGIYSGEWQIGDLIPSENQLCKTYNISRNTCQKAIEELVQEGILARKQGVGTFVTAPKIEQELSNFYSFTDAVIARGLKPTVAVVSLSVEPASQKHANLLHVEPNTPLLTLTRVRYADGDPIMLETSYIPYHLVPGLEKVDFEHHSLYKTMASRYQIYVTRAKEFFEPVLIRKSESKWLKVDEGSPAILLDRIAYTTADHPVEFCRSIVPGKKCRFYTELR
ncbi:MAG: GntR family transcriptional regulator [Oscillospiraceae bacterium]|nr:GntR family transcriptional regulator [Oscillospiraceae bacterium]